MTIESDIPAPKNPLTKQINLTILRYVRSQFFQKHLPTFEAVITSDIRTEERNKAVGGVPNSTHVHGLGEDFKLKYKAGGAPVPEAQAKAVFDQFIKPYWPGYAEWEASSPGEGYHVHVQLSREISTYTAIAAVAGLGVLGFVIINNWGKEV